MYKVFLIGLGNAGLLYEFDPKRKKPASHYGGILSFPEQLKLSGVCDINPQKKQIFEKIGIDIPFFENYKKGIEEVNPDIITIASWTNTHKEIFLYALKRGVKGIVLEKPIAKNLKDADEMLEAWENYKIPVIVNHERRWDSRYVFLKKVIDEEQIGKIKTVYGRVLLGKIPEEYEEEILKIEGGGPLLHDGTHLIDIFHYLFGKLKIEYVSIEKSSKLENRVIALLYSESNKIPIFMEAGGERNYFHFSVEVEGTRGKIIVGNGISEIYETQESRLYSGFYDLIKVKFPFEKLAKSRAFDGPYYEIIKAIEENNPTPYSGFLDGYYSLKVIEEIYSFNK